MERIKVLLAGESWVVAWTSDIGPHRLPDDVVRWPGYARLWRNVLSWVTQGTAG